MKFIVENWINIEDGIYVIDTTFNAHIDSIKET